MWQPLACSPSLFPKTSDARSPSLFILCSPATVLLQVRGMLEQYTGELKRIFNEFKGEAGYPDLHLQVL